MKTFIIFLTALILAPSLSAQSRLIWSQTEITPGFNVVQVTMYDHYTKTPLGFWCQVIVASDFLKVAGGVQVSRKINKTYLEAGIGGGYVLSAKPFAQGYSYLASSNWEALIQYDTSPYGLAFLQRKAGTWSFGVHAQSFSVTGLRLEKRWFGQNLRAFIVAGLPTQQHPWGTDKQLGLFAGVRLALKN